MQGLKSFVNYLKRADKLYWFIMLAISVYSLLLLRTVPNSESGKSYFTVQLVAIAIGYFGAILFTLID